jgi:hypothetical protein
LSLFWRYIMMHKMAQKSMSARGVADMPKRHENVRADMARTWRGHL